MGYVVLQYNTLYVLMHARAGMHNHVGMAVSSLFSIVPMYISLMRVWELPASYNALTEYGHGCRAFDHVFSQLDCGSCGAFATASMYGMRSCKHGRNDLPSPYRIFDCGSGNCSTGMSLGMLLKVLRDGVTDLAKTPAVYGWGCPASGGPMKAHTLVPLFSPSVIKREIIARGPVFASFEVSEAFWAYKEGVYIEGEPSEGMAHAVVVIGWGAASADEPEHWIIQNSWATDWGDGGRGKMEMSWNDLMASVT